MDHPVYVPHPRLLSASFHTFVQQLWLIDRLITHKPINNNNNNNNLYL